MKLRKTLLIGFVTSSIFSGMSGNAVALESETELLLKLFERKGLITDGESRQLRDELQADEAPQDSQASKKQKTSARQDQNIPTAHFHSIQSITDRVDKLEQNFKTGTPGVLSDKFKLGVLLEVEANTERLQNSATGSSTSTSDILLSTAALTMEVRANEYVAGQTVFQYEEGVEDDHVFLDEGIVFLAGKENCPYAVKAGRMYVPFGHFESHFVSDPLTLTLGETRDSALVANYSTEVIHVALGGFRGDIKKAGKNDRINAYLASLKLTLPEKTLENIKLSTGISYISSIAESKNLRDTTSGEGLATATLADYVPGHSAFVSAVFRDTFFLDLEYLAASKHFQAGELAFDNGLALRPETWNLEIAFDITDALEIATRYEGSRDYAAIQPEQQVGLAVLYKIFTNTSVTLEYLKARYANENKRDRVVCQLSVAF